MIWFSPGFLKTLFQLMEVLPVFTSMSEITNSGASAGKGVAQRNLPSLRSSIKMPPASPIATTHIVFLAGSHGGIDPLHRLRIGTNARPHQCAFVRVVG